jgi:hypothetical protein
MGGMGTRGIFEYSVVDLSIGAMSNGIEDFGNETRILMFGAAK